MSADPPSLNPFRRKDPSISTSSFLGRSPVSASIPTSTSTSTSTVFAPTSTSTSDSAYTTYEHLQTDLQLDTANAIPESIHPPKKATKKVRVQSPPPSSPSLRDSASTIGENIFPPTDEPPSSIGAGDKADPFDTISTDVSDDEAATWPIKAPANPFQKTLESMERAERGGSAVSAASTVNPARASLDVEAFKRLLMTGNAGVSTSVSSPPTLAPAAHHYLGDGSSSTDASSISRQSIFEAIQEAHPESPRTSHDISEPDDYRRGITSDTQSMTPGRRKPHPPSSRHGKLITVELRDDGPSNSSNHPFNASTTRSGANTNPLHSTPSQSDLNKPLPPAPNRASNDSDRESIFDREAAGKIPEPTSPFPPMKRKTPPAPPISRRHSQRIPDSSLARSTSVRVSPKVEERDKEISAVLETGRPRSNSAKVPPPPPSRRPAATSSSSHHSPLSSPSTAPLPAPPPARGTSRHSSSGRPSSVLSLDMTNNKRASIAPPPPPRSRHSRSSIDAPSVGESRRQSGEQSRRSIDSTQHDPDPSSLSEAKGAEGQPGGHDILADLSALQREIDALRSQSEKEHIT